MSETIITGISDEISVGTCLVENHHASVPDSRSVTNPPKNPAPTKTDTAPPIKPGAIPERPAIANAMYPESAATINCIDIEPIAKGTAPR